MATKTLTITTKDAARIASAFHVLEDQAQYYSKRSWGPEGFSDRQLGRIKEYKEKFDLLHKELAAKDRKARRERKAK